MISELMLIDFRDPFEAQPKGDTKKRVGVTNSLVPPKKALVAFDKQRKAKGNSLA